MALYAAGMTTRDIGEQVKNLYEAHGEGSKAEKARYVNNINGLKPSSISTHARELFHAAT